MSIKSVKRCELSNMLIEKMYADFSTMGIKIDENKIVNKETVCKPITVDDLYKEILFIILHGIVEDDFKFAPDKLLDFVQKAFQIPGEKHSKLLKDITTRKPYPKTLCIEVDRAENLSAMDSNGLSDPFVTIYIDSNITNRYNTSVMESTLNPSWKEQFLIPITADVASQKLVIEVWDFDAAESVSEKVNKFAGVKGIRGFKKLIKEIAFTASTGKHDNELIGKTIIPLQSIPGGVTGVKSWYALRKGSSNKTKGSILLHLYFSTPKSKKLAIHEYSDLLRVFLLNELQTKNHMPFMWSGKHDTKADAILKSHSMQSNLSETDCAFCQWETYTQVHETFYLSLTIFHSLLEKLLPEVQDNSEKRLTHFWEGYRRILPSCFLILRYIRCKHFDKTYGMDNLKAALTLIKKAEPPYIFDLFPRCTYEWLHKINNSKEMSGHIALGEYLKLNALQFLKKVCNHSCELSQNTLDQLIYITKSLIDDIQIAVQIYDQHFYLINNIKYATLLYNLYQEVVANIFLPQIKELCSNLNKLNNLDEEIYKLSNTDSFESGTLLFDLYLGLKKLTNLGAAVCLVDENRIRQKVNECFYPAVASWLNISVIKTLISIDKAIELDEFVSYYNEAKYSSSALDTLSIFYQIKYFWKQLDWPVVEESYLFLEKIIHDICRCCTFYANRLSLRIKKPAEDCVDQSFREIYFAVNDMNYVKESLPLFLKELKVEYVISTLVKSGYDMEAERCSLTINNMIHNTIDIVENKMIELIEVIAEALMTIIENLFEESCSINHCDNSEQVDKLKSVLMSIGLFQNELNDFSVNKLKTIICDKLAILLQDLLEKGLKKYRLPLHYKNILRTVKPIFEILNYESNDSHPLKSIFESLNLSAMETGQIIHKFYANQLEMQSTNSQSKYGQLTIRAYFSDDSLHVHVLNAYQLASTESERPCSSYVKVYFSPAEEFTDVQNLKTSVQHRTRFPLYDEFFTTKLKPDQRQNSENILVFCIKNKDIFGLSSIYIAECYLSFGDIEKARNKQVRINLNKPKHSDDEIIRVLESRTGDKHAKHFLRKLRQ